MNIQSFKSFNEEKSEKWIQDTKMKKGALHKQLGLKKDEKIPDSVINKITKSEIGSEIEVNGEQKKVTNLLKKRATLAKTLKGLKEHQETQNYMFFGNLQTIKRLVDEMLEMDESKLDSILSEHDWASDHISVATENLEQVFDFLASHNEPEAENELIGEPDDKYPTHIHNEEPSFDETEGNLANKDLEDEMKNLKKFGDFK